MNNENLTNINKTESKKILQSYITGFILSIILTLVPYILVMDHLLTPLVLVGVILVFAFVQLAVQLLFFLHIRQESKPPLSGLCSISIII